MLILCKKNFFYFMNGTRLGALNLFIDLKDKERPGVSFSSSSGNIPWSQPATLGVTHNWLYAQVNLGRTIANRVAKGWRVRFSQKPTSMLSYNDSLAIDDITFSQCHPDDAHGLHQCDFSAGMCGWRNDNASNLLEWSIERNVMRNERQKLTDHQNTPTGYYACVFIDQGLINHYPLHTAEGRSARLRSSLFDPTTDDGQCFTFYYFVYGNGSGSLTMWLETHSGLSYSSRSVWRLGTSLTNEWKKAHVNVKSSERFRLMFDAVMGRTRFTSVAIDEIELLSYACMPSGECDFENDWCFMNPSMPPKSKYYNWQRGNSFTGIGPSYGKQFWFFPSLCSTQFV